MRGAVEDKDKIRFYMDIAAWSSKEAMFQPARSERQYPVEINRVEDGRFRIRYKRKLPVEDGALIVRVYTLQFKANISVIKTSNVNCLEFPAPGILLIHDPRRATRINLSPNITKLVTITKPVKAGEEPSADKGKQLQAVILDISANGIACRIPRKDPTLYSGARVHVQYAYQDLMVDAVVTIVGSQDNIIRAHISKIDKDLQRNLNQRISDSLDHLIERYHRELSALMEASEHLRILNETKRRKSRFERPGQLEAHFVQVINPCFEAAVNVFDELIQLPLEKRELDLVRISNAIYDISAQLAFKGPNLNGNLFLCMKEDTAKAIARCMHPDDETLEQAQMEDVIGEMCNIILGNSKKNLPPEKMFRIGCPAVIVGKEHLLAALSKYPMVRMVFDSKFGRIDLNLSLDEVKQEVEREVSRAPVHFEYREELINPIVHAAENIFKHFLALDVRKKGAVLSDTLAPKFEISAIQDLFAPGLRGKVMLNISDKLALKVHETLLMGEVKKEVDEEVKDAIGEMLNIIAGNAKAEFDKLNIQYQLTTPFVVQGRNLIVRNAGNDPFLSSVYWTNEGFFELCFCLTQKIR